LVPEAFDGAGGDAEGLAGFLNTESAEEAEFDEFGKAGVVKFEAGEGGVEGEVAIEGGFDADGGFVEVDEIAGALAFAGAAGAGLIDEDAAHGAAGDGEEVGAIIEGAGGAVEAEVGFVDEVVGLEGAGVAFAAEEKGGEALELFVGGLDFAGVEFHLPGIA
jgi:hypothetical protein